MGNNVRVIGVHPIEAEEPVYLVEIEVSGAVDDFDFGELTQEMPDKPRDNWQVAYDEQELARSGKSARFAFFFHFLDNKLPLQTSFGPASLPRESPVPEHLKEMKYEQP